MKRILIVLLLFSFMLPACSQQWDIQHEEMDELRGTEERDCYRLVFDDGNNFEFYSTGDSWKVGVSKDMFKINPMRLNKNKNFVTYAKIGFYNEAGENTAIFDKCELEVVSMYLIAQFHEGAKKKSNGARLVAEYLRTQKGYVRILIPTNIRGDFDVRIPCLNNALL